MPWKPGDVIRIWDRHARPPKFKRHICVSPEAQLYLRINSEPLWPPHHLLTAAGRDFLDHDSYVELQQLYRHLAYEVAEAEYLGMLSPSEAAALCGSVSAAPTLSAEHKQLIIEKLRPF